MVWGIINWFGVSVETIGRMISKTDTWQRLEKSVLSPREQRYFDALLSAPLMFAFLLSTVYFWFGYEAGNMSLKIAVSSGPLGVLSVLFFLFCAAQTSMELKNRTIQISEIYR